MLNASFLSFLFIYIYSSICVHFFLWRVFYSFVLFLLNIFYSLFAHSLDIAAFQLEVFEVHRFQLGSPRFRGCVGSACEAMRPSRRRPGLTEEELQIVGTLPSGINGGCDPMSQVVT